MSAIYCFTNKLNNKQYIGSTTKKANERYNEHIYSSRHSTDHAYNYPLQQAIRKYGIENFDFSILYDGDMEEESLRKLEHIYILEYNCLSPNGYNQTLDTTHPINDPIIYQKISEIKRTKALEVAEIDSDNNIINTWRSIVDCAEAENLDERKIASCCRGERLSTSNRKFVWIKDGELIIPKYLRDPYKGEVGSTQIQSTSKKVAKYDDNNNLIKVYDTIAQAARENNCDPSGISKVCRGLRNKVGGFNWKYV